ncbi:Hydroxyacylglutathione hydrolase [Pseudoruegeria aquimaris]|uniref:Hydroxyacylglutathione hydrolase n=1 Tax=Pseudoruegeria aquimaris TaxID=393663 RepID=A0A1Y5T6Q5_9RHOB|nr:hydroxyacylglutathione hydrolase [Pseudoruegeria aquimaris]SLN57173.1 Hydroxyacylglutathione hydrolase [Pseudoruegeria aquimaris]
MPLEIVTIPCLSDNYAYLLHEAETGATALVDAPEADPIRVALDERGWGLDHVLLTHHHWDHVDGLAELREAFSPQVWGAKADAERLPALDHALSDGDTVPLLGEEMHVFDVSGHTIGHIAFHFPASAALFTADSLMAMGCGRLFEGTPEMMMASLGKLAALPGETRVYSGHEYTAHNARFAITIEPGNPELQARMARITEARSREEPTVPSTLAEERATNPFLRAHVPAVKAGAGLPEGSDLAVFTAVREARNGF